MTKRTYNPFRGVAHAYHFLGSKRRDRKTGWLEQRKLFVGASEMPAILGVGYANEGPWTIWDRKVNGTELEQAKSNKKDPLNFVMGAILEEGVGKTYEYVTDNPVKMLTGRYIVWHNLERFYLGCTLDGVATVDGTEVPLECKVSALSDEWAECHHCLGSGCEACYGDGRSTPLQYVIQLQHQMAVTGAPFAILAAYIGRRDFQYRRINRDPNFIEAMLKHLDEFWKLVKKKRAPRYDASIDALQAINRFYKTPEPGKCVELPGEAGDWIYEYGFSSNLLKAAEVRKRKAETLLKAHMGDAEYGALPDGRYVRWQRTNVKEATITRKEHIRHRVTVLEKLPEGITYEPSSPKLFRPGPLKTIDQHRGHNEIGGAVVDLGCAPGIDPDGPG